jgi:hypothetical protein
MRIPAQRAIAQRFSALAQTAGSRQRRTMPAMERGPDCRLTRPAQPHLTHLGSAVCIATPVNLSRISSALRT